VAEKKMMWPGFHAVFGVPWPAKPFTTCIIDRAELSRRIRIENRHEAIFNAVEIYAQALRKYLREEEARPQMWFAVVPEEVFKYGRPKSLVPKDQREKSTALLGKKGRKVRSQARLNVHRGARGCCAEAWRHEVRADAMRAQTARASP
jgi:hypothetical protein